MLNRANTILFLLTILFCQGCVNLQTQLGKSGSQDAQATESEPSIAKSSNSATAVSRVYRDPVTGEFTNPPQETSVPKAPGPDRQTVTLEPVPALKETAIESGGTLIHLQGRFRSYMSATKATDGKVTVHCDDRP